MGKGAKSEQKEDRAKPKIWQDNEVEALIRVWSDEAVQRQLQGGNKSIKTKAWKTIVERMNEAQHISCTKEQCKNKMSKLRIDYESVASGSEGGEDDPPFWDLLHPIFSTRRSSKRPAIHDRRRDSTAEKDEDCVQEMLVRTHDEDDGADLTSYFHGLLGGDPAILSTVPKNNKPRVDDTIADNKKSPVQKPKAKGTWLVYSPYRKRGLGKRDLDDSDKLIQAIDAIEERAAEREEKRHREITALMRSQQAILWSLVEALRAPPPQSFPGQSYSPFGVPQYGPPSSYFSRNMPPLQRYPERGGKRPKRYHDMG